jgi:hypothetical protein
VRPWCVDEAEAKWAKQTYVFPVQTIQTTEMELSKPQGEALTQESNESGGIQAPQLLECLLMARITSKLPSRDPWRVLQVYWRILLVTPTVSSTNHKTHRVKCKPDKPSLRSSPP